MPVWHETINLKHVWNHEEPWNTVRDAVTSVLKKSRWYTDSSLVQDLVEELDEALNVEEFDSIWNDLYNEADRDRVWLATF